MKRFLIGKRFTPTKEEWRGSYYLLYSGVAGKRLAYGSDRNPEPLSAPEIQETMREWLRSFGYKSRAAAEAAIEHITPGYELPDGWKVSASILEFDI